MDFLSIDHNNTIVNSSRNITVIKEDEKLENAEYLERLPKFKAKYKYKGEKESDLSLELGSMVYVEKKKKNGWWVCISNGKRGLVPGNYLIELNK